MVRILMALRLEAWPKGLREVSARVLGPSFGLDLRPHSRSFRSIRRQPGAGSLYAFSGVLGAPLGALGGHSGSALRTPHSAFRTSACILIALLLAATAASAAEEAVGKRPYEMEWAKRTEDHHPPLVDFEDLAGWKVECKNSEASLVRTREQQIWGRHVGKLTYRATAGGGPEVRLLPPQPIAVTKPFDAVTLWIYGNNWGHSRDPSTPAVGVTALFEDAVGEEFGVYLYHVDWKEWNLLHKRLTPEQITRVEKGARFKGILIAGGRNKEDRVLYFDNLVVYKEEFPPLTFEPRPKRGIAMFAGQSAGTNTGPGKLPFPTRPETILPDNLAKGFKTFFRIEGKEGACVFSYVGPDGTLTYRLEPKTGTWSDLTAQWTPKGGRPGPLIRPCAGGGVYLQTPDGPKAPAKVEFLSLRCNGNVPSLSYRVSAAGVSAEVTYSYRLWNKSLVIDTVCPGGQVGEVRYGRALGLESPRLVTNPYYPADRGRPAVAVSGALPGPPKVGGGGGAPADAPLFLTGNTDWYLSNASSMWAANEIGKEGVLYNGGTRYNPKTDGTRNDCYDRFFLTLSPRYEEMLPTIPNPKSPWKHVTGTRVWRAHGAYNREHDARYWTDCHRWGMTRVAITDHETGWRDGGESFTFRTRPAPGKGGDKGQFDYARLMQDTLGFVYGPYNNYTDFSPVNEYWHTDRVGRTSDNQLQHAWMRCYAPKPARAVDYCARLAPEIQRKFKFSTAYCDVHTAVAPWHRVDYDARVPGAGTMAATFYSYGEIMLHQKKAWNGPVYSEGNYHSFYSGLTDGNYAQDQSYRIAENPWLVDFDLRKMHDLGCNFGMGNPEMFYTRAEFPSAKEGKDAWVDRFLAATVAFGHPGFLTYEGGFQNALRSYYMLQQLHSRYCLESASEIRYADARGNLLETSAAVASGAHKRSQVVTRYSKGTVTVVNGSPTERMAVQAYGRKLDLPPNGYCGWTADGAIQVLSSDPEGHRSDYAVTPAYTYVDGRGKFVRFPKAGGNGIGICRTLVGGQYEILLYKGADCGFAVRASSAVALDKERKRIGPARLRTARGLTYVVPVEGAFSYLLTAGGPPLPPPTLGGQGGPPPTLSCDRTEVFAGERVVVRGKQAHEVQVPRDARPGQRLWVEKEGGWIDFTVVPLAEADATLEGNAVRVALTSNMPEPADFVVKVGETQQAVRLEPRKPGSVTVDLGAPVEESADVLTIEVRAGEMSQRFERGLRTLRETAPVVPLPEKWTGGMCLRGGKETTDFGQTHAYVVPRDVSSGEVTKKAVFMHPPYIGGTGYSYALYDPVALPAEPKGAFRAVVGKGDGSDLGDGILYKLVVVDEAGKETVVAEKVVIKHEWTPIEADLSAWAGKTVGLKLISDVGEEDNSSGDWAGWAEMRIETLTPQLFRVLDSDAEAYRRLPAPYPATGLTVDDLRKAKSGWLRYDGKGLSGTGEYGTFAVLNGIDLGNLAPAGGGEREGVFVEKVGVPLTAEAIRSLGVRNRFAIRNPKRDCFSVRRFWIELELADGRRCSSEISAATYTQPAEWLYAEGIGVSGSDEIAVDVWFRF